MSDQTCFLIPNKVAASLDAYLSRRSKAGENPENALARVIREGLQSASFSDELEDLVSATFELPEVDLDLESFSVELPDLDVSLPEDLYIQTGPPPKRKKRRKARQ